MRLWQIQPVRDILILLSFVGLLWLGSRLSIVTVPLLLAVALAYLFEPLVARLTRSGRIGRPGIAGGIIVLGAVLVVVPLALALAVAAVQGTNYLARQAQNVALMASSIDAPSDEALRNELHERGKAWSWLREYIVDQEARFQQSRERKDPAAPPSSADRFDQAHEPSDLYALLRGALNYARQNADTLARQAFQQGAGAADAVFRFLTGAAGRVGSIAFGAFLTAFFFFFVCTGWGRVLAFWKELIPERKQSRVFDLVRQMDRVIAGFVRGRLIICAILMVHYTIGYALIGVPAWLILGPVVGVLALVPYAQTLAAPVAMLLMVLQPSGDWRDAWWWVVLAPLGLFAIAQMLDDYVLTPRIQGKTTNMDTPTILFASIAGGALAGVYGLLVAIPTAACLKILIREVVRPRFRKWAQGQERDFLPIER